MNKIATIMTGRLSPKAWRSIIKGLRIVSGLVACLGVLGFMAVDSMPMTTPMTTTVLLGLLCIASIAQGAFLMWPLRDLADMVETE